MIDAILVPRGSEARAVREGVAGARSGIAVVEMGVGPRAATLAANALVETLSFAPRRVLITGLAGVLSPSLGVGDALVYSSLLRVDEAPTQRLLLDREFAADIATRLPSGLGGIVAVESATIVTRAAEKHRLAETSRAAAVDMESFSAAEALRSHGVECAVVRIGSDALDDDLPNIERSLNGNGGIDGFALFLAMAREPVLGAKMAINGIRALGALRKVVRSILA